MFTKPISNPTAAALLLNTSKPLTDFRGFAQLMAAKMSETPRSKKTSTRRKNRA